MSKRYSYSNASGRRAGGNRGAGRRGRRSLRIWPIIVVALVVLTGVLIILALKNGSAFRLHAANGADSSPSSSLHYPDLHIARGTSKGASGKSIRKDYEGFTLMFNTANHTPDWCGWELLASETDGEESRSNKFWADESVAGCPTPNDYRNSGFDKGHLCPSADQKWSADAMHDCFVMTNMTPQVHALNAVAWATLEKKERLWAQRDSAIVIVAGPIYTDSDTQRIGDSGVRVPSAFFKVLLAPYVESPRAIGFVFPNMSAPGNMENYSMTVDEIEELTGLDFFSSLPDEIEQRVESRKSFTEWNR